MSVFFRIKNSLISLIRKCAKQPTEEELVDKRIADSFTYLHSHGVQTNIGDVELIGRPFISCRNGGQIIMGKGVVLVSETSYNPAGINHPVSIVADGPDAIIRIGDNTGISGGSLVTCSEITIGKNVMIGANCNIYGTDFHCIETNKRLGQRSINEAKTAPIIIKDNCWIGANSTILKGVTIGINSVVSTMSLVNKDVPDNCLAAGIPAHVVRKNEN